MSILIEVNNEQPIPLMWYLFILLFFFRILALENIATILTTGPRLIPHCWKSHVAAQLCFGLEIRKLIFDYALLPEGLNS